MCTDKQLYNVFYYVFDQYMLTNDIIVSFNSRQFTRFTEHIGRTGALFFLMDLDENNVFSPFCLHNFALEPRPIPF